jgi:hypothetical protein
MLATDFFHVDCAVTLKRPYRLQSRADHDVRRAVPGHGDLAGIADGGDGRTVGVLG